MSPIGFLLFIAFALALAIAHFLVPPVIALALIYFAPRLSGKLFRARWPGFVLSGFVIAYVAFDFLGPSQLLAPVCTEAAGTRVFKRYADVQGIALEDKRECIPNRLRPWIWNYGYDFVEIEARPSDQACWKATRVMGSALPDWKHRHGIAVFREDGLYRVSVGDRFKLVCGTADSTANDFSFEQDCIRAEKIGQTEARFALRSTGEQRPGTFGSVVIRGTVIFDRQNNEAIAQRMHVGFERARWFQVLSIAWPWYANDYCPIQLPEPAYRPGETFETHVLAPADWRYRRKRE